MSVPSFEILIGDIYRIIKESGTTGINKPKIRTRIGTKYPLLKKDIKCSTDISSYYYYNKGWSLNPKIGSVYSHSFELEILNLSLNMMISSNLIIKSNEAASATFKINSKSIVNEKISFFKNLNEEQWQSIVLNCFINQIWAIYSYFENTKFEYTYENIRKGLEITSNLYNLNFVENKDEFLNKLAKDVLAAFDAIYTTNQTLVLDKKLPNFNTTDQQVKQLELDKDKLLKKIEQLKAQKVAPKTVSNKT